MMHRRAQSQRWVFTIAIVAGAVVANLSPGQPQTPPDGGLRIVRHEIAPDALKYWQSLQEQRPPLRGYRAPILNHAGQRWPTALPGDASLTMRAAANAVAHNLARNGLLSTTAEVMSIAGAGTFVDDAPASVEYLRFVGLPVEFINCFRAPGQPEQATTISTIAKAIAAGIEPTTLAAWLNTFTFRFTQTVPGFQVFSECGNARLDMLRLQLSRGDYWQGVGDGGNIDMLRQLVELLPEVRFMLSIEQKHERDFLAMLESWSAPDPQRITLVVEPLTVAQWAQDNGKPGRVNRAGSEPPRIVTLVPRFASRGEDGSTLVPGETLLLDGLAAAGMTLAQSPLVFQGGDLLAVRDPQSGKRTLLIGEAELYRHTARGLTIQQTLEAYRIEFGVDQCVPLPAVSFHIDFEVTVRAADDHVIAFVNDTPAATRIILECGIGALERGAALTPTVAARAREHLAQWDGQAFLQLVLAPVMSRSHGTGHFPESFAALFSAGPADSGVGNLQRFLLAMDMLLSWSLPSDDPRAFAGFEPHMASYLRSFERRDNHRNALHAQLQNMGFEVVPVPSMGDADRGINYLNGIHDQTRYLMPTYGGLYAPLDAAAKTAFEKSLGPNVTVVPIHCSESQRRVGGLHCSASAYYH